MNSTYAAQPILVTEGGRGDTERHGANPSDLCGALCSLPSDSVTHSVSETPGGAS
jgi:hypothetical protein